MEQCIQCGRRDHTHPWVAIMAGADVKGKENLALDSSEGHGVLWFAMPIDADCHNHPTVKAHFFPRATYKMGLYAAGSRGVRGANIPSGVRI